MWLKRLVFCLTAILYKRSARILDHVSTTAALVCVCHTIRDLGLCEHHGRPGVYVTQSGILDHMSTTAALVSTCCKIRDLGPVACASTTHPTCRCNAPKSVTLRQHHASDPPVQRTKVSPTVPASRIRPSGAAHLAPSQLKSHCACVYGAEHPGSWIM